MAFQPGRAAVPGIAWPGDMQPGRTPESSGTPAQAGWYAVPGRIWPGDMQPGRAGPPVPFRADVTFNLGIPAARWAAGSPHWEWLAGEAYGI